MSTKTVAFLSDILPGGKRARMHLNALLIRISRRAKYFMFGQDDADSWIEHCAELECRRLQNESENLFAAR